jgi:hypothetical protein
LWRQRLVALVWQARSTGERERNHFVFGILYPYTAQSRPNDTSPLSDVSFSKVP